MLNIAYPVPHRLRRRKRQPICAAVGLPRYRDAKDARIALRAEALDRHRQSASGAEPSPVVTSIVACQACKGKHAFIRTDLSVRFSEPVAA